MSAGVETQSSRRPAREAVKALAAACIGNFVEWYDFAIYAYSVPVIATLFFPQGSRTSAILAAFALWGVAFLARPLGGVFWVIWGIGWAGATRSPGSCCSWAGGPC